jgi:phosphoribosyl 1,2-cyclic phosphate phosphodiesterase
VTKAATDLKVTVLGCGASSGVPWIGNDWGDCDPDEPRNVRSRASIVVESATTRILVDTSPDLRRQMLDNDFADFDAVVYTHAHADHAHGIDDVRVMYRMYDKVYPVYASPQTFGMLKRNFSYAFESDGPLYPPFYDRHDIDGPFRIGDIDIVPFDQEHGDLTTTGFQFGPFAYSTDLVGISEAGYEALATVDTWMVQALRPRPHPTHAHLDMALGWIDQVKPRRAILTHMTVFMDYGTLVRDLPPGVEPAYDGMAIDVVSQFP